MGRNCSRALENGPSPPGEGHFQEQGHSFSASEPTLQCDFGAMRLCHFNIIENIFKLKLFVHAIQFCTREI